MTTPTPIPAPLVVPPRRRRRPRAARIRAFAEKTRVPIERSEAEIKKLLRRHGGTNIVTMTASDPDRILVYFKARKQAVHWAVPLPAPRRFLQERAYQQEIRRLWRALAFAIKARFVAVESGVEVFESAFLGYIVDPRSGLTFGQILAPQLAAPTLPSLEASSAPPVLEGMVVPDNVPGA